MSKAVMLSIRDCEKCDETRASACNRCIFDREIKHPPQSWCYVLEDYHA